MKIATVGLDIAKQSFQVHAADSEGRAVLRKRLRRAGGVFFREPFTVFGRARSLLRLSLLVSRAQPVRPHRATHRSTVRQAVCEVQQERRQ